MSKPLDGTDRYADDLAVSTDLDVDPSVAGASALNPETSGEPWNGSSELDDNDAELEPLFRLRLNMARARAAKSNIMRGQLARLDAAYVAARAPLDRQMLEPADRELMIFTAAEIVRRHNPPALEYGAMAEAKLLLREVLFKHLLLEQERINIDFRIVCVNEGREKISWGELSDYLLKRHWPTVIDALSPLEKNLPAGVSAQLESASEPGRLRALCFSYPLPSTPTLDIYNRAQLETFYGHLLSAVSGLHRERYEQFSHQRRPLQRELELLDGTDSPLPSLHELGPLAEQLRLHLLQQLLQQRINRASTGSGTYDPQLLLERYQYFGKSAESRSQLAEFEALPENNLVAEGVDRLLGRNTRQKIIAALGGLIPSPWLVETTAEMLALIDGLELAGQKGVPEARTLASQFGQELRLMLGRASAIKKPADPSIIEGLFQGMKDQVRLAKYCFRNLSRSTNS